MLGHQGCGRVIDCLFLDCSVPGNAQATGPLQRVCGYGRMIDRLLSGYRYLTNCIWMSGLLYSILPRCRLQGCGSVIDSLFLDCSVPGNAAGCRTTSSGFGRMIDWLVFYCSVPGNAAGCRTPSSGFGRMMDWLVFDCSVPGNVATGLMQ